MSRRNLNGYVSTNWGGVIDIEFPIYVNSIEGSGDLRHVEPNETTLNLIEYLDSIKQYDGNYWYFYLPEDVEIFLILDNEIEFKINVLQSGSQTSSTWYYIFIMKGWWEIVISRDGSMTFSYD